MNPKLRPVPPAPTLKAKPQDSWLSTALASRTVLVRLLCLALACETGLLVVQPYLLVQLMHQRERVVVLDTNGPTYSISPLMSFEEAKELHESVALDAAQAMFNRGPAGLDRPDMLKLVFYQQVREKVERMVESENTEFRAKGFHQKLNAIVKARTAADNSVVVNVAGQLIRTGVFEGRVLVEAKKFNCNLTLLRNPNMLVNKRYPLAVCDFDIKFPN